MEKLFLTIILAATCAMAGANNGTVVGSPGFGTGKFGNGLATISDSNYITLPTAIASSITGSNTVELWFKPNTTSGFNLALSINGNWLGHSGANFGWDYSGVGFSSLQPVTVSAGTWYHVAMVISGGSTLTVYLNGVQVGFQTGTFVAPGAVTTFVGRYNSPGLACDCSIDEISLWTSARYTTNFTPPTAEYTGSEPNLFALYHLETDALDSKAGRVAPKISIIFQ